MKIKINTKIIRKLKPCKDRFDNGKKHYGGITLDALQFLALDKITFEDKLWVVLRLAPRDLVVTFALDCGIKATDASAAVAAASAASAAADAADAATVYAVYAHNAATTVAAYAAAKQKSQEDSLDALAYLISSWDEKDF